MDEAIACFRRAIELEPNFADAYNKLGYLHKQRGQVDQAIAYYEKAIEVDPNYFYAHMNLGDTLAGIGRIDESITCFRTAIKLDPKFVAARNQLARVQRLAGARDKLPAFKGGSYTPPSNDERLVLAEWAQIQKLYRTSTRLYAEAFAADPKLAENLEAAHRYNAACFAALAAAGKGTDAAELDDQERARLRKQALDWLRSDLIARAKQLETAKPADRAGVQNHLRHSQIDADLACVRGPEALAKLSESERKEWNALWAEVQALIDRARKKAH